VRRLRLVVLVVATALVVAGLGGWAWTAGSGSEPAAAGGPGSTTTTARRPASTTTTTLPAPTTTAAPAPPPSSDLARGSAGPAVEAVQRRLHELRLDPGPVDGRYGGGTLYAVQGFQKLAGLEPTGVVGPETEAALEAPPAVVPLVPGAEPDRVEVDLGRQLLLLWQGGELRLVSHVSTGSGERYCEGGRCGTAVTPTGAFRFSWRYPGWRTSRLGRLYNPVYFTSSGIAVHGATSVPTYPASHGCVRIPMHIAEYFPDLVDRGDAVYVVDGPGAAAAAAPVAPTGPPPADPPAPPEAAPREPPAPPPPAPPPPPPPAPAPAPAPPPAPTTTTPAPAAPPAAPRGPEPAPPPP
jgi:peptidoglycan hydrolase-like protein with peptidoglycan-binding domain